MNTHDVATRGGPAPLVSVVIPAYNAGSTLEETLGSLLAQTYPNIEIIVVNDGSSDTTADVLRAFGNKVQPIYQTNSGLPVARNTGCLVAVFDIIALIDADDLCEPNRVAVQICALRNCPDAVLCTSDFSAFSQNGPVSASYGSTYYSMIADSAHGLRALYPNYLQIKTDNTSCAGTQDVNAPIDAYTGNVYRQLVHGNFVHPPTVMFRRNLLETAGLFDEGLSSTCDWEWLVRASRKGDFVHIKQSLLRYRLSPNQMSLKHRAHGVNALEILRTLEKIFESDPDLLQTNYARIRRHRGNINNDVAYALAGNDKIRSAVFLARGVWLNRKIGFNTLKILLRIIAPAWLARWLRRGAPHGPT